jgi:hypothetical protein
MRQSRSRTARRSEGGTHHTGGSHQACQPVRNRIPMERTDLGLRIPPAATEKTETRALEESGGHHGRSPQWHRGDKRTAADCFQCGLSGYNHKPLLRARCPIRLSLQRKGHRKLKVRPRIRLNRWASQSRRRRIACLFVPGRSQRKGLHRAERWLLSPDDLRLPRMATGDAGGGLDGLRISPPTTPLRATAHTPLPRWRSTGSVTRAPGRPTFWCCPRWWSATRGSVMSSWCKAADIILRL